MAETFFTLVPNREKQNVNVNMFKFFFAIRPKKFFYEQDLKEKLDFFYIHFTE